MNRRVFNVLYALMVVALPGITLVLESSVLFSDGALLAPVRLVAPSAGIALVYLGWLVFQGALMALLPGKIVQGMPLADGQTLSY